MYILNIIGSWVFECVIISVSSWLHKYMYTPWAFYTIKIFECETYINIYFSQKTDSIIGASVSGPHMSELNGRVSLIYMYVYYALYIVPYVFEPNRTPKCV